MKKILIYTIILSCFLGCATKDVDKMMSNAAWDIIEYIPEGESKTLVVYYFLTEDNNTKISDYITNGLTTEIANAINDEGADIKVVSRKALDQILEELSFQMSDLADQETQVSVGKQLGADIILTGNITPYYDSYKLNAQLIEIETGVVLGGFIMDFWIPPDLDENN